MPPPSRSPSSSKPVDVAVDRRRRGETAANREPRAAARRRGEHDRVRDHIQCARASSCSILSCAYSVVRAARCPWFSVYERRERGHRQQPEHHDEAESPHAITVSMSVMPCSQVLSHSGGTERRRGGPRCTETSRQWKTCQVWAQSSRRSDGPASLLDPGEQLTEHSATSESSRSQRR